ncbi:paramyosin [Drosophila kikkawai]|uniref:Paramyosin n=1 Tax=Drosophila kikkawai TaxID=30033 RepID=A0A6P4JV37_DROKI|nr:uncharacterized protein LOC108086183 [Drosophila kikkawai]
MEPNSVQSCDDKPPETSSCDTVKPIEPAFCSQASYKFLMMDDNPTANNSGLKASQIAHDAAEEANAANEAQAEAAQNASQQVKLMLAERAMAAANAATSLLEGKQAIVDSYANEIQGAESVVAQITASLETSQANEEATCAALRIADNHEAAMQIVVDQIRSGLEDLDTLVEQSQADLEEEQQMVAKAKDLGDRLAKEFKEAKAEYDEVKMATCRAVSAAMEIQRSLPSNSCFARNIDSFPGNSSSCDECPSGLKDIISFC